MRRPVVVDANRYLEKKLKGLTDVDQISVGRTQ
jgi:hypothetical protein